MRAPQETFANAAATSSMRPSRRAAACSWSHASADKRPRASEARIASTRLSVSSIAASNETAGGGQLDARGGGRDGACMQILYLAARRAPRFDDRDWSVE